MEESDVEVELDSCEGNASLLRALHQLNWAEARKLITEEKRGILTRTPRSRWTALHFAVFNDAPLDVVEKLIDSELEVDAVDNNGYTSLYLAAMKGRTDLCKKLLQHGANPNIATSNFGLTPVHAAVSSKEVLQVLLDANGDPNFRAEASAMDNLLKQFASLEYGGMTPLSLAVKKDAPIDIVEILLRHGADPSVKDLHEKNALDYARELKRIQMVSLLDFADNFEELQGRRCLYCRKLGSSLLPRCAGCDEAAYCNQVCQKLHWPTHKKICPRNKNKPVA